MDESLVSAFKNKFDTYKGTHEVQLTALAREQYCD